MNLEARGEVLKGRCPPWAQDPCSDGSVYLWNCGSCLQGSKFGFTKLLSCDNGQFFVWFSFKCPRWWWGVTLWMVRAHWWENMCSGEDNWGAQSVFLVFQSLPRNGCLKDMRNIGKTTSALDLFLSLGWIEIRWEESNLNLEILLFPKLHAKKGDALLLFSINNVTLGSSQVFHSSLDRIESLSWIKLSARRWGDTLCLVDYFTATETICFLCLFSTNLEN